MNAWLVRGLVLAVFHVAVRALVGFGVGEWPMQGTPLRLLSVLVMVLAAAGWGFIDARRDSAQHPGEDEGADLTMLWLKSAVLGGLAGGVLAWLVDMFPNFELGDSPLFFELSAGAAWTILLIFIPAMLGVGIGHFLARRAEGDAPAAYTHSREPVAVGTSGTYGNPDASTEQFPSINNQDGKSE